MKIRQVPGYISILIVLGLVPFSVLILYLDKSDGDHVRNLHIKRTENQTVSHSEQDPPSNHLIRIAIGLAIAPANDRDLNDLPFFAEFLPSFCRTASNGYDYRFYLGHDQDDTFFASSDFLFRQNFRHLIDSQCKQSNFSVSVFIIRCQHNHKPAWAQNDVMVEAYMDDCDYYYRINDDIQLQTPRWTEIYIDILRSYQPPNVGVVGPENGVSIYLTFEFVHRTHLDIFGFYYPRIFKTWWADYWMTIVYYPKRTTKTSLVKLNHTSSQGIRYRPDTQSINFLPQEKTIGSVTIKRYVNSFETKESVHTRPDLVIAMSVDLTNANETLGAIRNAQLTRFLFKEWSLLVFCSTLQSAINSEYFIKFRNKIEHFGGRVRLEDVDATFPLMLMAYCAADDVSTNRFIVRSPLTRLSSRDEHAVGEWLNSRKAFHCICDHAMYSQFNVHLWGAKGQALRSQMNSSMHQFIGKMREDHKRSCANNDDGHPMTAEDAVLHRGPCADVINQKLWEFIENDVLCHCSSEDHCERLPVLAPGDHFIGRPVSGHGTPLNVTSAV